MATFSYLTSVRALDSNGDFTFGAGTSNYLVGNAAIGQNINTRLAAVLGNCFFDLASGINWFNLLGTVGPNAVTALNIAISTTILNTSQVTGLLQLSSNLTSGNREFSCSYKVQTVYSALSNSFSFQTTIGG